ncbi:MAG: hypothetical protein HOV81_16110 [Kofleriaceae bacterium]|nr:hypothetical protein [Kofleriaceae bacterium]
MPSASVMAEEVTQQREPGAPYPKDNPTDPELTSLRRPPPKVTIVTAAGIVFLSVFFLLKLNPDRRFAGAGGDRQQRTVADIVADKVEEDSLVAVAGEPLMAHAIRTGTQKNSLGMRVVPLRGSSEKVWVVLPGDGWEDPTKGPYVGRLRKLDRLPFADTIRQFVAAHPRPVFAPASAVRAGFATGKVATVSGDEAIVRDADKVGFDVIDPDAATVVCTYNERHQNVQACAGALAQAGIETKGQPRDTDGQAYFDVAMPGAVATVQTKLEAASLWSTRVDPVTRHYETTWGALKGSAPAGFTVNGTTLPDATLDLVGLYVAKSIPSDAYAVIIGENPKDYWYVLPVTIVVALIGLLFAWALVRAVKRDLLPTRA